MPSQDSSQALSQDLERFEPCAHLRTKRYFFLREPAKCLTDLMDGSNAVWCDRTQQVIGPDNGLVETDACIRGEGKCQADDRKCFLPDRDPT